MPSLGSRGVLTVRFPPELLADARQLKAERESLNDFVLEAVDREVRRRRGLRAYETILGVRDVVKARTGLQPDSARLIRALRRGEDRRA